jgi:hypothetical protein
MNESEAQMQELSEIRSKIEESQNRKNKLEGELKGYESRIIELQEKCQEKFGVEIEDLADIAEQLEKEADEWISEAKDIMGM